MLGTRNKYNPLFDPTLITVIFGSNLGWPKSGSTVVGVPGRLCPDTMPVVRPSSTVGLIRIYKVSRYPSSKSTFCLSLAFFRGNIHGHLVSESTMKLSRKNLNGYLSIWSTPRLFPATVYIYVFIPIASILILMSWFEFPSRLLLFPQSNLPVGSQNKEWLCRSSSRQSLKIVSSDPDKLAKFFWRFRHTL